MKNVFDKAVAAEIVQRIDSLAPDRQAKWGTMNVGQMLAHCNVTYDMALTEKYVKPTGLKRFLLKSFVKGIVVSEKPYSKNGRTAAEFVIADKREFDVEKKKLIDYVKQIQEMGEEVFENKESHSFGKLNKSEWNNMFYKHLDHHLTQFGA